MPGQIVGRLPNIASWIPMILISESGMGQVPGGLPMPRAELDGARVEVPMDLTTRHPIIEVRVNGGGPFRFIYDTGAGGTMIDQSVAASLNLPTLGKAHVGDASGEAGRTMPIVRIESVVVGGARFVESVGIIGDLSGVFPDDGRPDGILAFHTFADCLATLDYPNSRLVLEVGELPVPDGRDVLKYVEDHHLPVLRLDVGEEVVPFTIDSGAATGGVIAESLAAAVPTRGGPVKVAMGRRFNTEMEILEARLDATIRLGRHAVERPVFHFGGTRSVIGFHVLRHFALTFDQKNHRVRFSRDSEQPITFEPRYSTGFGADSVNGKRTVWYVLEGLPADVAGLRVGDVIDRVNGREATRFGTGEWRDLMEGATALRLSVSRDGQTIEIVIRPGELVP